MRRKRKETSNSRAHANHAGHQEPVFLQPRSVSEPAGRNKQLPIGSRLPPGAIELRGVGWRDRLEQANQAGLGRTS